ncbi:MAG: acyl--CoA ligase [Calditrichae bacterium]|nr:acyl--CoA ligase [Calditrichia bacterium]
MLVHNFLELSAQNGPAKNAVWFKEQWMTYQEIDNKANSVANYLVAIGIKRGDRVALLYENSHDYIINYYAILKSGAVTVSLNNEITVDSLTYLINDSGAKAIITNKKFSRFLIPALQKTPYLKNIIIEQEDLSAYHEIGHCDQIKLSEIYNSKNYKNPNVRTIDIDLASIVYTSGSTGKAKGVTLSHLNIITNTRSITEYLKLTASDRILVVLPFYYIYGKSLLNTHFSVGGSVVIDNRFAFPNKVLETMANLEVTGFSGVPSTFMILLNKSSVKKYQFDKLRYITQAGGAMAPSIQKEVSAVFDPAELFIMYGATEASARLSYLPPEKLNSKWGSIGIPIPNVDLFVADESGAEKAQGETGQIVARGANIMQGYWNDKIETASVLKNGLYYTGDLGKMDTDGFLYVVGRTKDMIKVGGERISAKEIEEKILEINEIHETAVIGVEDETLGEAVKAFLVLRDNAEIDIMSVRKILSKKLPPVKQPKHYEIVEKLPKNESGKILKSKLKEMCN